VAPKLSLSLLCCRCGRRRRAATTTTTTHKITDRWGKEESGHLSTGGTSPLVKMLMDPFHLTIPTFSFIFFYFYLFIYFCRFRHSHSLPLDSILIFQNIKSRKEEKKYLERINKSIKRCK
jgi:hypothetical protein